MSKKNQPKPRSKLRRTRKDPTPLNQRQDYPQIINLRELKEEQKLPKESSD
jgi:hypothetical protein